MASSDEARDVLFHLFQDAYHLKDWIKNDPAVQTSSPEKIVNDETALRLCADLCNGTKHFGLNATKHPPRTGDPATAFTSQSVTVRPATVHAKVIDGKSIIDPSESPRPALHYWSVASGGQEYDALPLAADVVSVWEKWLRKEGLLT